MRSRSILHLHNLLTHHPPPVTCWNPLSQARRQTKQKPGPYPTTDWPARKPSPSSLTRPAPPRARTTASLETSPAPTQPRPIMSAASPPPPGVYVPVPTFFAPKGSAAYSAVASPPDLETQLAHALYLARAGIDGLVLLGSTGEAVHLTGDERSAIVAHVRAGLDEAGFPAYPLIAGTASQAVAEVVGQLAQAAADGAQWGLVLAPGFNGGAQTQEGLVAWFTAVADASPIPVLIYNYPAVSNGVRVTPATFVTLARHPNIVGTKLSHADVSCHAQVASHPAIDHARFHVFTGLGQQLLPAVAVGCHGAIDGSAAFFPKTLRRLWRLAGLDRAATAAEAAERRRLQFAVSAMEELVVRHGTVGIKEAVARLRGFGDPDGTRLPLRGGIPGGDAEWARWKDALDAVQALEDAL